MADELPPSVYGLVTAYPLYHVSTSCGTFKNNKNRSTRPKTVSYPRIADAIAAGHQKLCPVCSKQYIFRVRVNNKEKEFSLNNQLLGLLLGMARLQRDGIKITIGAMAQYGELRDTDIDDRIKQLRNLNLVCGAFGHSHNNTHSEMRRFTAVGIAVVLAYDAGCYVPPLVKDDTPVNPEDIYRKI
jgi:hypothetical protein